MGKRKGHPIVIVGGIVVIIVAFIIFVPAILGATAAGGDLEKYNGTSQQGNDTVKTAHAINTYLVGITGIPLTIIAFAVGILMFLVVIIWAYRGR